MEYRITTWYYCFRAMLSLAFLSYGAWQAFTGVLKGLGFEGLATFAWGVVLILLGYFIALVTFVSIAVSGKQATFTNLLMKKETITISNMLIGESHVSQGFVSMRFNSGRGSKNIDLMFFRDWKGMVKEIERETGIPLRNKQAYLKY